VSSSLVPLQTLVVPLGVGPDPIRRSTNGVPYAHNPIQRFDGPCSSWSVRRKSLLPPRNERGRQLGRPLAETLRMTLLSSRREFAYFILGRFLLLSIGCFISVWKCVRALTPSVMSAPPPAIVMTSTMVPAIMIMMAIVYRHHARFCRAGRRQRASGMAEAGKLMDTAQIAASTINGRFIGSPPLAAARLDER